MCLILLAHEVSPEYPLVLVANRDEFFARPTRPAGKWDDHPNIIAGRDLLGGGTWMGVNANGRFAAVTNFRDPANTLEQATSRGELVTNFLTSSSSVLDYLSVVKKTGNKYNGFNLIVWLDGELGYVSNCNDDGPLLLDRGIHGLSNAYLNTPWPKVLKGKELLRENLRNGGVDKPSLFELIRNQEKAPDNELPSTGVTLDLERDLSSMFIRTSGYGTRNSSLVLIDAQGKLVFAERNYDEEGQTSVESVHSIDEFATLKPARAASASLDNTQTGLNRKF